MVSIIDYSDNFIGNRALIYRVFFDSHSHTILAKMPYAYIKFLEGPKCGHKYTVDASKIKYKKENDIFPCKFPDLKFGETKKYYIEHSDGKEYKGQIIFLESKNISLYYI